jgi:hypothetical protein
MRLPAAYEDTRSISAKERMVNGSLLATLTTASQAGLTTASR